jgi:hypothetical protein
MTLNATMPFVLLGIFIVVGLLAVFLSLRSDRRPSLDEPITKPVDYGDGLTRIPNDTARKVYDFHDGWIDVDVWAAREWTSYQKAHAYGLGVDDGRGPVCPYCYHVSTSSDCAYLAEHHPDAQARKRWSGNLKADSAKLRALGACRCQAGIDPAAAAQKSQKFLSPYYPPIKYRES